MNYDNYYKKGGMTKEESISAIALRIGARKDAVEKFVEEHKIDTNKLNSDLKSGDVYFMDVITAIVGKPNNKYQKEVIKKYGSKMAKGGEISVYNLRKGDKVKTRKGDIETIIRRTGSGSYETIENDYTHSPESLEFLSRPSRKMAMGGKTQGYDDREDERLGMKYGKMSGKDFDGSDDMREHSRRDDARFEERMENGGKVYYTVNVGDDKTGGEEFVRIDTDGMLYALTGNVSSGEIANITNTSKYADIDAIRSKAIQYYVQNGDKPYSYAELQSVLKKFDHTKMAMGGMTKEKEKLSNLSYQLVNTEDSFKKNNPEAYSRMKDAYKAQFIKVYGKDEYYKRHIMAMGGKTQGYDDREDERLSMEYGKMSGKDFDGSHDMREHSRRDDARFEERMARGGELTYDDFMVGDFYFNSSEGGKFKFVGKDESGRLRFQDSKGIDRIFSPKRMSKYAKGGHMAKGGLTNIKGTTEPKAYPEAEPNTNVVV
jgi:hypothetical protein